MSLSTSSEIVIYTLVQFLRSVDGNCQDSLELAVIRLKSLYSDMIEVDLCWNCIPADAFTSITDAIQLLESTYKLGERQEYGNRHPARPSFNVPISTLEYLMQLGLHAHEIGNILGVSRSTVSRRMREYGITLTITAVSLTKLWMISFEPFHLVVGAK